MFEYNLKKKEIHKNFSCILLINGLFYVQYKAKCIMVDVRYRNKTQIQVLIDFEKHLFTQYISLNST